MKPGRFSYHPSQAASHRDKIFYIRKQEGKDTRLLHWEKYPNYNKIIMDMFSIQILAAIKKIRSQKRGPDSHKIFMEVVKESSSNITTYG